ncbi:MAG: hypothetical protein K8L99_13905 [Anaerolineae bacterium]|nr:hypothetical protein [Anaerolineae bacterium]
MPDLKIAVAGAGSYVFGPSILSQAILEHRLNNIELALLDVDAEMVELMAGVGQRMARETGVTMTVSAHTDRKSAFEGADFVISAVIREMHKRFAMDGEIIKQYIPDHLQTEYGGISGISNSLRQIALYRAIAEDIRRYCPDAWLLNISNPLTRVCQTAHEIGVKTAGFCAVALEAYEMTWAIIHGEKLSYPYKPAIDQWKATTAGLNHFVWLVGLEDRASGEDLLPLLAERFNAGGRSANPVAERLYRETGYLLVPHDDHTMDFLPPQGDVTSVAAPSHGSATDRKARAAHLRDVCEGKASWESLLNIVSWERPVEFIEGLTAGKDAFFTSMNLINEGQIPNLPRNVFVDTPLTITDGKILPQQITLPSSILPLCERTVLLTDTIVKAGMKQSRALVHEAVMIDPTISDKAAGLRAIDASLEANADILGAFA